VPVVFEPLPNDKHSSHSALQRAMDSHIRTAAMPREHTCDNRLWEFYACTLCDIIVARTAHDGDDDAEDYTEATLCAYHSTAALSLYSRHEKKERGHINADGFKLPIPTKPRTLTCTLFVIGVGHTNEMDNESSPVAETWRYTPRCHHLP
jgi:hypothetical protein